MPNRYPGICYRCGEIVPVGKGVFEKVSSQNKTAKFHQTKWRVQHHSCADTYRGTDHHYMNIDTDLNQHHTIPASRRNS